MKVFGVASRELDMASKPASPPCYTGHSNSQWLCVRNLGGGEGGYGLKLERDLTANLCSVSQLKDN